jgi:hypothetical protein
MAPRHDGRNIAVRHSGGREDSVAAPGTMDRWRCLFTSREGGFESTEGDEDASERVERAHEALERLITDRFGADPGLLRAAREIALTGAQAVDVLQLEDGSEPSDEQLAALEAVVAFDGSRPSFLVKQDEVDFDSSFNTAMWQFDLKPFLAALPALIGCTGRVELGEKHIGTAFLVTPTLALTNRHVVQAIAEFADPRIGAGCSPSRSRGPAPSLPRSIITNLIWPCCAYLRLLWLASSANAISPQVPSMPPPSAWHHSWPQSVIPQIPECTRRRRFAPSSITC